MTDDERRDVSVEVPSTAGGRVSMDVMLREVVAATASAVGEGFFRKLVRHLAVALQVRCAFVGELVDGDEGKIRLLASWVGDGFSKEFECPVEGTPCQSLGGRDPVHFPAGIQQMFPDDVWLTEVQAESYLAVPLFSSDGEPLGCLGVVHDERMDDSRPVEAVLRVFADRAGSEIERRCAEGVLERSEHHLRALVEKAPVGILVVEKDGNIIELNERIETMFGYRRKELLGRPLDILVPDHFRDSHSRHMEVFQRNPKSRSMGSGQELSGRRRDGSTIALDIGLSFVKGEEEDVTVAVISEITGSRESLDALHESEAKLAALVSAMPDAMFLVSRDGTFLDIMHGEGHEPFKPRHEVIGKSMAQVLPPDLVEGALATIQRVLQTRRREQRLFSLERDGRPRHYEARYVAAGADRVLVLVRDITDQRGLSPGGEQVSSAEELEGRVERQMTRRNPYGLTFRELTVLDFLKRGATDKEVAGTLSISVFTVNKHVSNILAKMDSPSRTEASIRAINEGLID